MEKEPTTGEEQILTMSDGKPIIQNGEYFLRM
jgi:hypothetical protein